MTEVQPKAHPGRVLRTGDFKSRARHILSFLFAIRTPLQKVGSGGSRYGVSAHFARSRTAASRAHSTWIILGFMIVL